MPHKIVSFLNFAKLGLIPKIVEPKIQLMIVDDFLSRNTCEGLIRVSQDHYAASRVGANGHNVVVDRSKRDSESCFLTRDCADSELVQKVNKRLLDLYDNHDLHSDHLQIHKYNRMQFFGAHHDYLHVDTQAERIADTGQRTWTMIVFLNDDFYEGCTEFPELFIKVRPKRGSLVVWNNLNEDGSVNPLTLHKGNPVTHGTKYLLSKWFRDLPISEVK